MKIQLAVKTRPQPDRFRNRARTLKPIRSNRSDEAQYKSALYRIVDRLTEGMKSIVEYLKQNRDLIELRGKDSLPEDELKRRLREMRSRFQIDSDASAGTVRRIGNRIKDNVDDRLRNELRKSVGIDIKPAMRENGQITERLNTAVKENVALIKSIPDKYFDQVESKVVSAVVAGQRHEQLARLIHDIGQSTYRRAEIIARDQVSKMNSSFNKIRQTEFGITHYKWSTSLDERVRPTHSENEGKVFSWDDPPEETGNPGEDIMCRCVAVPYFDLDAMEAEAGLTNSRIDLESDPVDLPVLFTHEGTKYSKSVIPNAYEDFAVTSHADSLKRDSRNLDKMLTELQPYDIYDPTSVTVQEVPISSLSTVQSVIKTESVKTYKEASPIVVYKMPSGRMIIKNGNHRANAAKLSGKTHIKAKVMEFKK